MPDRRAAGASPTEPAIAAKNAVAPAKPHVLVVDDEAIVAEEIADGLASLGFRAEHVNSAEAALRVLDATPTITVLVSDIRMPTCTGLELAARVLAGRLDSDAISVVLITANANLTDALEALKHGVSDFVRKPFRRDEIGKAVLAAHEKAMAKRNMGAIRRKMQTHIAKMIDQNAALSLKLLLAQPQRPDLDRSLTDALAARGSFLALVSHELRTPLVPVIGFAELLASGSVLMPEQVQDYAGIILDSARLQLRLIDNIILLTRLATGQPEAPPRVLEVGALITAAAAEFRDAAQRGLLVLDPSASTTRTILAVRDHMVSALGQLLANALPYARTDAPVVVQVHETDDMIEIRIADRGPGLPFQMAAFIGVPFVQNDMRASREKSGLGLGLALATRLLALYGGRLDYANRPDGGTEAVLFLPAHRA